MTSKPRAQGKCQKFINKAVSQRSFSAPSYFYRKRVRVELSSDHLKPLLIQKMPMLINYLSGWEEIKGVVKRVVLGGLGDFVRAAGALPAIVNPRADFRHWLAWKYQAASGDS